jgi:DNA-binding XRE family transcriptional regulator
VLQWRVAGRAEPTVDGMERSTDLEVSEFGLLLRRFRIEAGLTQDALAERAGVGTRTIQDLERGAHQPLSRTLKQLVRGLTLTGE